MRIAIVADVHSNLEALQAVLRRAEAGGPIDALWCPGDIVGYGPEPAAVLEALRARPFKAVAGNHDLAACGRIDTRDFNRAAARAAEWTGQQLSPADRVFLGGLQLTEVVAGFTLVHGSLRDPVWEYLLSGEQALAHFESQATPFSVVGHSHVPFWVGEAERGRAPRFHAASDGDAMDLGDRRLIINPGSCGQPRDGDTRASFVLYDDEARRITWHRVEYDVAATQEKMRLAGLDAWLVERLSVGR